LTPIPSPSPQALGRRSPHPLGPPLPAPEKPSRRERGKVLKSPTPSVPAGRGKGAEKPNRHEVERVVAPLSRQVGFSGAGRGDGGEGSTPTTPGAPMAGIFKAYDVRGTVPDQVNPAIARQIGLAF